MSLIPKWGGGLRLWVFGGIIEIIGFKILFAPEKSVIEIIKGEYFVIGLILAVLGLRIALSSRRIKKW